MTAEEMEVAYCKGRRASMKSITRWLKEHAQTSRKALELGISAGNVLELTLGSMEKAAALMDEELGKMPEMISEADQANG